MSAEQVDKSAPPDTEPRLHDAIVFALRTLLGCPRCPSCAEMARDLLTLYGYPVAEPRPWPKIAEEE